MCPACIPLLIAGPTVLQLLVQLRGTFCIHRSLLNALLQFENSINRGESHDEHQEMKPALETISV